MTTCCARSRSAAAKPCTKRAARGSQNGDNGKNTACPVCRVCAARGAQAVRRAVEARGQAARQHAARLCAARHSKRARRARQAFAGAESFQRSRHRRPRRAGTRAADLAEAGVYLMYIGQKARRVFTREGYAASVEQQSC
jgi:hypothetical protein